MNDTVNQPQTAPQQSPNNGPEDTIRDGSLKATIWRRNGQNGDYFTTDFAKTYEDEEGKLKDSRSFGDQELLRISELARKAHDRNTELRREEFKARRENGRARGRSRNRQSAPDNAPDREQ